MTSLMIMVSIIIYLTVGLYLAIIIDKEEMSKEVPFGESVFSFSLKTHRIVSFVILILLGAPIFLIASLTKTEI